MKEHNRNHIKKMEQKIEENKDLSIIDNSNQ